MKALLPKLTELIQDRSGAVAVEFAMVFIFCLALTLGLLDGTFAYFQWIRTDKALQEGIRTAVVSDYILSDLGSFECFDGSGADWGLPCSGSTLKIPTAKCTSDGTAVTCTCSSNCGGSVNLANVNQTAFDAIVNRMQVYNPNLQAQNLVIAYTDVGLGFAGRPGGAVPAVTLSLQNMAYDFFVLNSLFNIPAINMPSMATTLTGEDQSSG